MDDQPDSVSFGPPPRQQSRHGSRVRAAVILVLVACLGVIASLALLVVHRDDMVAGLRAALRDTGRAESSPAATAQLSGSAMFTLPGAALGSFSMVAVAVRARPGAAPLAWLFIYGKHAGPGQHYGLLEGTCGGQYVTASDLADGTADRGGNLTITVPGLGASFQAPGVWFMLYRWEDGAPLGGVQGPLAGHEARVFLSAPSCS